jgi:hypothetical protein
MAVLSSNPFTRASYTILAACLVVATVATLFDLRLALLPAALVFGWSQIGGL